MLIAQTDPRLINRSASLSHCYAEIIYWFCGFVEEEMGNRFSDIFICCDI